MTTIKKADLTQAYDGSYYTIAGCGGPLIEWVDGINRILAEEGIGKPVAWYKTKGRDVNAFAGETTDPFQDGITLLMFPLDGLDVGRLAILKLRMGDRWFDDVIDNMRERIA